ARTEPSSGPAGHLLPREKGKAAAKLRLLRRVFVRGFVLGDFGFGAGETGLVVVARRRDIRHVARRGSFLRCWAARRLAAFVVLGNRVAFGVEFDELVVV